MITFFIAIWVGITLGIMLVALILRAEELEYMPDETALRNMARAFFLAWTWPVAIIGMFCYACYRGAKVLPVLWKEAK
jgi:hypothetical protein